MSYVPEHSIEKTGFILDLISQRQQAIGANLANFQTPGYIRQDVDFKRYIGNVESALETKLSRSMGTSPLAMLKGGEVNVSNEMLIMQKNMLFYSIATRRVTTAIQELKTIAQVGR